MRFAEKNHKLVYLMVIDVDIAVPACCIMNGGVPDV